MSKPSTVYTWATDANYSSGPASGTPTRTAPTSGQQTQGLAPGDALGAQLLGALLGNIFDWLGFLSDGVNTGLPLDGGLSVREGVQVGGQLVTFSPRTFTADSTTDALTVTANGLTQGDGPFRLTTTDTLPGGLATSTDYWIGGAGTDTLLLAPSFLSAINGGFINLTSNGTGTHTISSNSATHTADLTVNGKIVAQRFTGEQRTLRFGVSNAAILGSGVSVNVNATSKLPFISMGTSSDTTILPMTTPEGLYVFSPTIVGWGVRLSKLSSGTISAKLKKDSQDVSNFNTASTQIGTTQSRTGSDGGTNTTLGQTGLSVDVYPGDATYHIEVIGSGTSGDDIVGWFLIIQT